VTEQLNSKELTEAGPLVEIDHDSDEERGDAQDRRDNSLPGVRSSSMASKRSRLAARTACAAFSPAGRSWAAATTEGLLVYSLDDASAFDPLDLDIDLTPASTLAALEQGRLLDALMMALRLNEPALLRSVYERVPPTEVTRRAA